MRNLPARPTQAKIILRLAILSAVVCGLWALPLLSSAKSQANSITISNNSRWEIRHVYLSSVNNDNWGPDQINAAIHAGESATLNVSCSESQVKVVTEDQDGCFLYNNVACSGNSTVTITNDATPDCGN